MCLMLYNFFLIQIQIKCITVLKCLFLIILHITGSNHLFKIWASLHQEVAGDGERSTRGRASAFESWRKRDSGQVDSTQGGGYLWREGTFFPQNEDKWVQGQNNTKMEVKEEDRVHAHSPWVFSTKQCGKLMTAWKEHRALDFKLELYYSPLRLNPVCQRVEATCFRKEGKKRLNFEPQLWFLKHYYNCFWIRFWGWPLIRNNGFLRWRLSLKKGQFDYNELGWMWVRD